MKPGYINSKNMQPDFTGSWAKQKPTINPEKCVRCRKCFFNCPEGAITFDSQGKPKIDYNICKGCGICANKCPVKAILMKKNE